MNATTWQAFLDNWNRVILATPKLCQELQGEMTRTSWLGYPGASEEQIAQAEANLGVSLSPSYHAFLQVSNGWPTIGLLVDRLLPFESEMGAQRYRSFWELMQAEYQRLLLLKGL